MRTIISSVIMIMLLSCGQGKQEKATSGATEKVGAVMYHNGDILTMAGDSAAYAEAIVVKDGRILFVGRMDEAMKAAGPGHSMVDLKGGTLIPGFIDGHSHLTNYADATLQADLNPPPIGKVESISDIIATVKSLKEKTGAGDTGILIGYGYDADMLKEKRHPNAADLGKVLRKATPLFDGGFTIGGLLGNGHSFVMRDAHGIRPAYYYINDEVIVAASERAAIRTTFNVGENEVLELMPGMALLVDDAGNYSCEQILEPKERRACSFERIYFSRGSDEKIYRERIALGHHLSKTVLESIQYDLKNTIFSYIPNTAEVAFYGLVKGMEEYLNRIKVERILSWGNDFSPERLEEMVNRKIRQEKIAIKDVKLRTFITEDSNRNEMVQHVYDVTYGTVRRQEDTLVVIDDSIVRGTTLRESIVRMLLRLQPKKIIIVSSAPQIRYPDCYGIDMSKLGDFIAFRAVMALLKDRNMEQVLQEITDRIHELQRNNLLHTENVVRQLYKPFTPEEISNKIAELITPAGTTIPIEVIYQTIEDLHESCPTNTGDWYFTGNYPTPGGNRVVNKAFLNFMEGKNVRGY